MAMEPQAYLFDLDGTLVDTESLWAEAIRDFIADRSGLALSVDEVLQLVFGHSWLDIHADLHRRFPGAVGESAGQAAIDLRPYYLKLRAESDNIVIRSSVEMLKRVSRSAPAIIVSGSPHDDVVEAARMMGISPCLKFVLGAEDYLCGKPSPDGFLTGAEKLGVDPAYCVVFEDSPAGVASAKAAGMYCVALDRTGKNRDLLGEADWIVDDLGKFTPEAFEEARARQGA